MKKISLVKPALKASFVLSSAILCLLAQPKASMAESFRLVWSTNFDAPLNSWEWNIYNNAPFGSSKNTCFMGSNTFTGNGFLHLMVTQNKYNGCSGRPYASGALDTYTHRPNLTYGRWEVRAKMPAGYGATGYIGLFPVNGSWPPEIDFAEYVGKDKDKLFITQHFGTVSSHQTDGVAITRTLSSATGGKSASKFQVSKQCSGRAKSHSYKKVAFKKGKYASAAPVDICNIPSQPLVTSGLKKKPSPPTSDLKALESSSYWTNSFHTYTLEWVPGQLRYYIDGTLQLTQPQRFTATPNMMKLAIGTGTGDCGSWVGCPEEAASKGLPWPLPTRMRVDYIKMYEYVP